MELYAYGLCISYNMCLQTRELLQLTKEKKEGKQRKDYTFRCQFNEEPSIIQGCPVLMNSVLPS